jgi:hypothetical protein
MLDDTLAQRQAEEIRSRGRSASAAKEERGMENNHKPISLALLFVSLAALAGMVFGGMWFADRGLPILLPAVLLGLLGVLDIVWACHARSARRLAILDAYAEREIARSRYQQDSRHKGPGEGWQSTW